jgi:hypothetical protein
MKMVSEMYFMNEAGPIVLNEGMMLSGMSRGVKSCSMYGRTIATATDAKVLMPYVSEKMSTIRPRKKAQSNDSLRDIPEGNFNNKYM